MEDATSYGYLLTLKLMSLDYSPARALIVVAKRPQPGHTKTRLTPPLTAVEAAELYECFLRDTLDLIRQVPAVTPVIAYLPIEERPYFAALAPGFELCGQRGSNLGSRLDHALRAYLERGYDHVAIMNSDAPSLPPAYLVDAFARLEAGSDVVLGPTEDGGYYLIGANQPVPRLLRQVRMSTATVLEDTLALATMERLQVDLLSPWYDVDDEQELARLQWQLADDQEIPALHTRAWLRAWRTSRSALPPA